MVPKTVCVERYEAKCLQLPKSMIVVKLHAFDWLIDVTKLIVKKDLKSFYERFQSLV